MPAAAACQTPGQQPLRGPDQQPARIQISSLSGSRSAACQAPEQILLLPHILFLLITSAENNSETWHRLQLRCVFIFYFTVRKQLNFHFLETSSSFLPGSVDLRVQVSCPLYPLWWCFLFCWDRTQHAPVFLLMNITANAFILMSVNDTLVHFTFFQFSVRF